MCIRDRLCAVRLVSGIKVNRGRNGNRSMFVVSAYAPTNMRLSGTRENQIGGNQAGLRPRRGCIDLYVLYILRQLLEQRHSYCRPTIVVFLDLKAAFDSVDRRALWHCLSQKGVPLFFNLSMPIPVAAFELVVNCRQNSPLVVAFARAVLVAPSSSTL